MKKTTYYGNSWIGMFARTNNEYTIVPADANDKFISVLKENLGTDIIKLSIAGSNLVGIYTAMNSKGVVVPDIIYKNELSILEDSGLDVYVCGDRNNANGNNISLNDSFGIANPNLGLHEIKGIEDTLKVKLSQMHLSKYVTVGSICSCNNKGFLVHYNSEESEVRALEKIFGMKGATGTVNTGTGFVSLGAIVNDHSYVVGEMTTAFEMGRIEDALGFLQ